MRNVPEYCSQNEGNCWKCSLSSFGRDCTDNPLVDDDPQEQHDDIYIDE
jgi:hypothetical protein